MSSKPEVNNAPLTPNSSDERNITATKKSTTHGKKPVLKPSSSIPPVNNNSDKMYTKKLSTLSLPSPTSPHPQLPHSLSQGFINLEMLQNQLGASSNSLVSNSSRTTSFSGISHVINNLIKTHSINKTNGLNKNVADAIDNTDLDSIQSTLKEISEDRMVTAEMIAMKAIEKKNTVILQLVLNETLLDTSIRNNLLFVCVEHESLECCRLLLQHGLSPNTWRNDPAVTTNDVTPLHLAIRLGHLNCLKILHQEGNGNLNAGADETSNDGEELSLLHTAVKYDRAEVVEYLLENKANKMGGKRKFSATPLHVAAELNHHKCAELLLQEEVLVDALKCSKRKETALHMAAQNGYFEVAEMLIKNSANVNARTGNGETPLHLASKCLSTKVMLLLINHGADVNAQDNDGRPPLHCVVLSKNKGATECMLILLRHNADSSLSDKTNRTALHLAAMELSQNRVNILIEAGADVSAKMDHGKPALFFIMKYCPNSISALEKRLDSALSLSNEDNDNCEVRMDFTSLIPKKAKRKPKGEKSYTSFQNPRSFPKAIASEVSFFKEVLLINNGTRNLSEKIILHPLSQGYLHLKWLQIKWCYYFLLFCHLIYSVAYSTYAVLIYKTLCPAKRELNETESPITAITECKLEFDSETGWYTRTAVFCWIALVLFTILHILVTVTKIVHYQKRFIYDKEIILHTLIIISFFLITFRDNPLTNDETYTDTSIVYLKRYQYHAAGIGVALTWLMQMYFLAKVPRFGKYIEMFTSVSMTFLNLLFAFVFFLIAFTLSFYILYPGYDAFDTVLPAVMVKVLVMMLGELEYEDIYLPPKNTINLTIVNNTIIGDIEDGVKTTYFPFTAHVALFIFVVFVSIILMNLLFGLAVADVQDLRKTAKIQQLKQQVEVISYMESMLFSPVYHHLPGRVQRFLTESFCFHSYVRTFQPNNFQEPNSKQFPKSLRKEIYRRCVQLQNFRSGRLTDSQKIERLSGDVKVIKEMLESLMKHQSLPVPAVDGIESKSEENPHKYSMTSLTHQFSMEEGSSPGESDDYLSKRLIDRVSLDSGTNFTNSGNRKTSKISSSSLSYIQEEESSIGRADSTDFDTYSGDSSI